jgi:hypothetical protein
MGEIMRKKTVVSSWLGAVSVQSAMAFKGGAPRSVKERGGNADFGAGREQTGILIVICV